MKRSFLKRLFCIFTITALWGCSNPMGSEVFTLYRNSLVDENMRIHVATFDSKDGKEYNNGNCQQAQLLFQGQPDVKTKFWCEEGYFKK
jgi:hypothetical protein